METETNRNKLIAGAAIAALVLGGGGVMLGRTLFAPSTTAVAPELRTQKRSPAEPFINAKPEVAPYRATLPIIILSSSLNLLLDGG